MAALASTLIFILSIPAILTAPVQPKAEDYRLPNIFTPMSYDLELNLVDAAFTNSSNEFSGRVSIVFSFTNASDYIALHADHSFITINRITFNNADISNQSYTINNVTDILKINVSSQVNTSAVHTVVIEYTGVLSTADMYGFYKSSYVDGSGATKYLATTQFESTYARRAFPCFDEPAFKATFHISITVPSRLYVLFNTPATSVSTTPAGLTTTVFKTTPKLPTYLIAFIISEFTCTAGNPVGTVPTQVCSRNESADTRGLAVELAPLLLGSLNNFTGYDYSRAMDKMDQVAIPDFAAGAMENWGLVTYRETALLWDSKESSNRYQQRVATVIAHEFAHQWFGDLVTMKWWSEIFLNEGFATYFEYYTTHEVIPAWELDKQFVIQEVHPALVSDALEGAHALQSSCSTPAEISSKFDTISYSKGGSVLRMVEHFMQLQNFKSGLNVYLVNNEFGNTEPEDLWVALNSSINNSVSILPASLPVVMENWVKQSGYPLLTVSLNGNQVTVSQQKFLLSESNATDKWYVPISYTTSVDTNKFQSTTPSVWLTTGGDLNLTLPANASWIILNNQQSGYYRVNYDAYLWDKIEEALLKNDFDGITDLNRAQIVDDLFNLARADQIKYSEIFGTIRFLVNDTSYYTWYPAFNGYNFLLMRVGENSKLGQAISSNILNLMAKLYESVPISTLQEDDQIYTFKQVLALTWACRLGHQNCVEEIQKLFNQHVATRVRPNRNLRSIVYCNGLRYSNNTSDWEFLWNVYISSADLATEQATILSALGCTKDANLLTEYLKKSITDGSGIRLQDASSVFSSVYTGSTEGVDIAFEFLIANYAAIAEKYQSMNSLGSILNGIADRFTTEAQITKLKNFIETGNLPEAFKESASKSLERAETNLRWLQKFEKDLMDYYNINSSGKLRSSFLAIVIAVLFAVVFV